jgi:hypothetical protein
VASTNETLREACAEVFEGWIAAGTAEHVGAGLSKADARDLTILFISALEGAFVLSRAQRTTEALEVSAELVSSLVEDKLLRATAGRRTKRRAR